MNPYLLIPFTLGVSVVFQAILNRSMGLQYGLAAAVFLNAALFFVLSLGFLAVAKYTPTILPEFWRFRDSSDSFHWAYLLPGLFGFLIVIGLPWSIQNIGPSTSFLLLISAQIIVSLILEFNEKAGAIDWTKLLGALLVLVGAFLTSRATSSFN